MTFVRFTVAVLAIRELETPPLLLTSRRSGQCGRLIAAFDAVAAVWPLIVVFRSVALASPAKSAILVRPLLCVVD